MFHYPPEENAKYGVIPGTDPSSTNLGRDEVAESTKYYQEHPDLPKPKRWMIFHETAISGAHVTRTPEVFTGRAYKMDEAEEKRFKELWDLAAKQSTTAQRAFPGIEIYFGNGVIHLPEEFLKRKFPKELFGSRGNEAASLMRLPETQPLDFIGNNSGLWMDRQVLDHYGYKDTPLRQCFETCYPNTNPGNLTESTQAAYFVRHMMHSLAWRIPIIRFGSITDMGNSYHHSNWGGSGLCHVMPEVNPKPSYVAVATTTQVLDGAKFTRVIPTTSPVVYALEFQKPDKTFVTCLWTLRGLRTLWIQSEAKNKSLTDLMGNVRRFPQFKGGPVEASPEPIFFSTQSPIESIAPMGYGPGYLGSVQGAKEFVARQQDKPFGKTSLISSLDKLSDWTIETTRNLELEVYNFMTPRRKGDFQFAEVAEFEGEKRVLSVRQKTPVAGSKYLPMYSVLQSNKPIEVPGEPTEIGLMVNGNGGWGRIIFELEDAKGQRWISLGAEQAGDPPRWMRDWIGEEEFKKLKTSNLSDWNSDDAWGRSYINFEGWRYMSFPLPGNYPGEGYHWPCSSQWRCSKPDGSAGDGIVGYPLKFKKLIVTMPERVLHARDYEPVARPEVYLKDLMATYESPEKILDIE